MMKNLATAFVKAKKAFAPALKNSVNPHFKNKYVDLASALEAVNDAFLDNGIAIYQETFEAENGVIVETVLIHESGESLRCGKLSMPASKHDSQGFMSALTYCRRGSLMTACGIAPEDDDGQAAVKSTDAARKKIDTSNDAADLLRKFSIEADSANDTAQLELIWKQGQRALKPHATQYDLFKQKVIALAKTLPKPEKAAA
jgi:hypothetical protein